MDTAIELPMGTHMDGFDADVATTTGLGFLGGGLALIFGKDTLRGWQKFGCVLAGGACAYVFTPLITVLWEKAPPQVLSAAGFTIGTGGMVIIVSLLAWWEKAGKTFIVKAMNKAFGVKEDGAEPKNTVGTGK